MSCRSRLVRLRVRGIARDLTYVRDMLLPQGPKEVGIGGDDGLWRTLAGLHLRWVQVRS